MKKSLTGIMLLCCMQLTLAQSDTSLFRRMPADTAKALNMDAVYNRPFLAVNKAPVAIGGYVEGNYQYLVTNGKTEGHQFQARRFTLFLASGLGRRIKFLSEIEFEDGTKEINIEFASVDVSFHPLFNWRNGIIMNPIGAFNQNHDGPKWEFVDRPISAVNMLPATWSNAGTGIFGKTYRGKWMFGYEFYLSGSFDNTIIENTQNKTYLPEAKNNRDRFEEINSGLPLVSGKVAMRHRKAGELGISYMGGVYNKFRNDGVIVDAKRRVDVLAVDYNVQLHKAGTQLLAEWAWIWVDVPTDYIQLFGNRQQGGYVDVIQPVYRKKIGDWKEAVINVACRFDYVDWNVGTLRETGANLGESYVSVMPAISFRPTAQTIFRINYRYSWQKDILNNPAVLTGGFLIGFSSYF